jgi:hypothetical protein
LKILAKEEIELSNKRCKDCYYGDVCPHAVVCEDFTPITAEAEEAVVGEIIENGREEFRSEWNTYISEI